MAALLAFTAAVAVMPALRAQAAEDAYDTGSPKLKELWLDPVKGNDDRNGNPNKPLKTLKEALRRIPHGEVVKRGGYRLLLAPGEYDRLELEWYLGSAEAPLIVEAAAGPGTVRLMYSNVYHSRFVYLIGVNVQKAGPGNVLHIADSQQILLRKVGVRAASDRGVFPREALKVNQCQYVYIEDGDYSGAADNAIDFVAVQYGHVIGNKIHDSQGWNMYVKGGSAHIRIERNEFYGSPEGGFTAGHETGFEYMVAPWLQWEASHVRFVNNYLHDIAGVGLGAAGAYDVLLAHNTLYRVGRDTAPVRVFGGARACGGRADRCGEYVKAGGWGRAANGVLDAIPSKNVFIYNNLIYNPQGEESRKPPFTIVRLKPNPSGENQITVPLAVDVNLQIRGNFIWQGAASRSLGVEHPDSGCQASNPSCNPAQLGAENVINQVPPEIVLDADGIPKPVEGGNLVSGSRAVPVLPFPAADPADPASSAQPRFDNRVPRDRAGAAREGRPVAGAYLPVARTAGRGN